MSPCWLSGVKVTGLYLVLYPSWNEEIITEIYGKMSSQWDLSKHSIYYEKEVSCHIVEQSRVIIKLTKSVVAFLYELRKPFFYC